MKEVNANKVQENLDLYIKLAQDEPICIKKNGETVAYLINPTLFRLIKETINISN